MLAFDRTISQFIANIIPHNYYMDSLFSFFALRGITFYIWVLPIILLLIYEKIHSRVFLLRIIAAFGAGSIIFSSIKLLVARSRPFLDGVTLLVNEPLSFNVPATSHFHLDTQHSRLPLLLFLPKPIRSDVFSTMQLHVWLHSQEFTCSAIT